MNGEIHVSSKKGKGSTFSIFLKASNQNVVTNDLPKTEKSNETIPLSFSENISILIVDDNPINLKVMSQLIQKLIRIKPICAKSGEEAIKQISSQSFQLVFLDVFMVMILRVVLIVFFLARDRWN